MYQVHRIWFLLFCNVTTCNARHLTVWVMILHEYLYSYVIICNKSLYIFDLLKLSQMFSNGLFFPKEWDFSWESRKHSTWSLVKRRWLAIHWRWGRFTILKKILTDLSTWHMLPKKSLDRNHSSLFSRKWEF